MAGLRVRTMFAQHSPAVRLVGHSCGWQAIIRTPARPQRVQTHIRSAASNTSEGGPAATEQPDGVKSKLFKILGPVQDPITAEELWPLASAEGLKSKRFMKNMLNDLRKAGKITTKPARGKAYGYILPGKWLELKKQSQRAAALAEQAGPAPKPRAGRLDGS